MHAQAGTCLLYTSVYIRSGDGLKLHGTYFPGQGSGKLVICFHGYTSKGMSDYIGLSNYYLPRGYQMLLVDERAHGDSEGTYIGFGCLDREDALLWITYAVKRFGSGCQIWPVSYTHLDVYKRQMQSCASVFGPTEAGGRKQNDGE